MQKAVTPIVSVILLLLITISITGFAMLFFQRTAQTSGEAGEQQLQQHLSAAAESFEIVNVDGNKVYIKNIGTGNLQNLRFYVDGIQMNNVTPITIAPNIVGEVQLNSSQLAMIPGDKLRVTSAGYAQEQQPKFYDKNAVAYWRFDDGERATVKDYSGNGNDGTFAGESWNDGTVNGAVPVEGKYGKAMGFDGTNEVTTGVFSDLGDIFTVSVWFKSPSGGEIVSHYNRVDFGPEKGWKLSIGGVITLQINSDVTIRSPVLSPSPLDGNWHHVIGIKDGSSGRLYYDGSLAFSTSSAVATQYHPSQPLRIGWSKDTGTPHINGTIDEVRIYNRALAQQETIDDMNSPYPIARTVASYSFEKTENSKSLDTHNIVKGRYGAAMSFDGVDDYVNVSNAASITPLTMTISLWSKTASAANAFPIEKRNSDGSNGWMMQKPASGTISFQVFGINGERSVDGTRFIADNNWHHITGTYNGTSQLYIDGSAEGASAGGGGDLSHATDALTIGANNGAAAFFNGTVDEVRVLNIAVS